MVLVSSILVAILFASGLFLLMRRNVFDVLLGTIVLSQATFVLLISLGGWQPQMRPPLLSDADTAYVVVDGEKVKTSAADTTRIVDPVPHALLLTAIVIAFGVTGFLATLIAR